MTLAGAVAAPLAVVRRLGFGRSQQLPVDTIDTMLTLHHRLWPIKRQRRSHVETSRTCMAVSHTLRARTAAAGRPV